MVRDGLARTGYDEVALTSLSSADFSGIDGVVADLVNDQRGTGSVSVSLPSLRVDAFSVKIATEIQKVRRTGLTFAPEAGSWRLRQVINKLIREEDLYSAVDAAYSQGWRRVKLYFLTGLPTEMDDDTMGIAELANNVVDIGRKYTKQASCTVSVGGFVPKPHTPFQWFGQNSVDELGRKISMLRAATKGTKAQVKWHEPQATFAEGIVSRGDRRIGRVIEAGVAGRRDVPGVERAFLARPLDRRHGRRGPRPRLVRDPAPDPRGGPALGPHRRRPAPRLPLGRLAGGPGGARAPRLPVDPLLRLRGMYRLRPRARGGLAARARGRQSGHGPGPERRRRCAGAVPRHQAKVEPKRSGGPVMRGGAANPVRLRYTKRGKIRWISHRDVARALERAFRITQLPLAFTEGFSPRPKVSFGLALSTGHESDAEYLDLVFAEEVDLEPLSVSLTEALPEGMSCYRRSAAHRAGAGVARSGHRGRVAGRTRRRRRRTDRRVPTRRAHCTRALELPALPTSKRRKGRDVEEDVLPFIRRCELRDTNPVSVEMELITQPRSAKPGEILAGIARATGITGGLAEAQVLRTHQWIERDGTRLEPLEADTRPRALEARAS